MIRLSLCSLVAIFVLHPVAKAGAADPRESLETAIPEAIRILEAKNYEEFFKTFLPPEGLKKFQEDKVLDKAIKLFEDGRGAATIAILKQIKDQKPELDKEGTTATYKVDNEKLPPKAPPFFRFKKVGVYWYIFT